MFEADALALLAIARRDLQAAQGMTDTTTLHEAVWGFQVQETIEKALKAWLYLSGVEPPFTHDLVATLARHRHGRHGARRGDRPRLRRGRGVRAPAGEP